MSASRSALRAGNSCGPIPAQVAGARQYRCEFRLLCHRLALCPARQAIRYGVAMTASAKIRSSALFKVETVQYVKSPAVQEIIW